MSATKEILENKKVISKYELLAIIILFITILIILFPKGKLETMIDMETSNYEVSIKYLESLSKAYPKHAFFKIALLRFYLKTGKLKKAENLIENCQKNKQCIGNIGFIKNSYFVYKNLYFKSKNKKYLIEAKKYLSLILKLNPTETNYEFVLNESKSMNFVDLSYKTLKKLVKINPKKEYLKDLLNISLYYKDYKAALNILDILYKKEKNIKYLEKKAQIYEYLKHSEKAKDIYLTLFKITKNENVKTKYFLKAVYILLWNKKYKEAINIAKRYENYFLKTRNRLALKKILDIYLQTGNLKLARILSLKILKVIN
ncbi:tetratricopeptide repeat protein [Hydrogenothermus marinus]|uniref:Tetratricopeptide repeat protein n=1 Tax=Hydrogenothermus marinus TaxID=133270 RepID=A0A3M0BJN9_9AQUI|nr:hypothetical protein [Hydrogenothermus marinus]RMA97663.1 hypothetical protein CLV39_0283 [Hydrogenothermus marinus]